jgi:hypothetical protein
VGLSAGTAIVGAPYRGDYVGAAYVFVRGGDGTWREQQMLMTSTPRRDDAFGSRVDVEGDLALVSGGTTVYAFERAGEVWSERQAFTVTSDDGFGVDLQLDGPRLVVGGDERAHVFVRDGSSWAVEATLNPSVSGINNMFGTAVAISGDTALVGGNGGELAAVFERVQGTWMERQILRPPHAAESYGWAVAIEGDLAVVGSTTSAYVYRRAAGTFALEQELLVSDPACFGCAVSIDAGHIAIGAHGNNVIHVFEREPSGWLIVRSLGGTSAVGGFGFKLELEGNTMVASEVYGEVGMAFVVEPVR